MKDIISISDEAATQIKKILSASKQDVNGIVVGVDKTGCSGYAYKIEYANKENPVLHGHAVHIGMQMATEFSKQKKIISMEDYQICKDLFGLFGYDFTRIKLNAEEIFQAMKLDKKNESDKVTLILLKSIGSPIAVEVDDENELLSFLQEFIDNFER